MAREAAPTADPHVALERLLDTSALTPLHWKINLLMNAGPNATTFILPAELFSTEVRASGHGFAAGAAKLGAALGIFVLPLLRAHIGVPNLLYVLALVCLAGLAITVVFHVETKGRSLEELDPTD
jgi:MFS transporter, putative metabolite transport protein